MSEWIRHQLGRRSWWMNALMLFSIYMAVVYVPWDLFVKPVAVDEEVWLGIRFHGVWAKVLAVPHWAVYALGAAGFWGMRRWMWPWAAVYAGQVAVGMLVWPILYVDGLSGWLFGLVSFALFGALTRALWRAKPLFQDEPVPLAERYGEWALVTGASAGIGEAFARALAARGQSVVLTARREERLEELAVAIEGRYGVKTRVVAADLGAPDGVERLLGAVADLEVAVLVNNAGFGGYGAFHEQDARWLAAMVQVNCTAPLLLTRALLPAMRERGRGAVIFTGSVAGHQPLPLHALYAATKAFDNLLGEALWEECRGSGVDVLVLEPGTTVTEFHDVAGEGRHGGQTPEEVVDVALAALGQRPSAIAGLGNWLRANAGMRLLPRSLLVMAARRVMENRPGASDA